MNYDWTPEKVGIAKKMLASGSSINDVAETLGVNAKNLKSYCYAHFIKFPTVVRSQMLEYSGVCKTCKKKFTRMISTASPIPKYCSRKCSGFASRKVKK